MGGVVTCCQGGDRVWCQVGWIVVDECITFLSTVGIGWYVFSWCFLCLLHLLLLLSRFLTNNVYTPLTQTLHNLSDEALEYLELMKRLGDEDNTGENGDASTVQSRTTNGRKRKGAKQTLRGPDSVAYRLAISACARSPGGHRWQDGISLLDEMREVEASRCA